MAKTATINGDWHPEDIKAAIRKELGSMSALEKARGLSRGAVRCAIRRPHFDAEIEIADALSLSPRQIWPSRYRGECRVPQVRNRCNPTELNPARHCQK